MSRAHRSKALYRTIPGVKPGTFVKAKHNGRHVTQTAEGSDQDGPSVAGVALEYDALNALITRLVTIRDAMARQLHARATFASTADAKAAQHRADVVVDVPSGRVVKNRFGASK